MSKEPEKIVLQNNSSQDKFWLSSRTSSIHLFELCHFLAAHRSHKINLDHVLTTSPIAFYLESQNTPSSPKSPNYIHSGNKVSTALKYFTFLCENILQFTQATGNSAVKLLLSSQQAKAINDFLSAYNSLLDLKKSSLPSYSSSVSYNQLYEKPTPVKFTDAKIDSYFEENQEIYSFITTHNAAVDCVTDFLASNPNLFNHITVINNTNFKKNNTSKALTPADIKKYKEIHFKDDLHSMHCINPKGVLDPKFANFIQDLSNGIKGSSDFIASAAQGILKDIKDNVETYLVFKSHPIQSIIPKKLKLTPAQEFSMTCRDNYTKCPSETPSDTHEKLRYVLYVSKNEKEQVYGSSLLKEGFFKTISGAAMTTNFAEAYMFESAQQAQSHFSQWSYAYAFAASLMEVKMSVQNITHITNYDIPPPGNTQQPILNSLFVSVEKSKLNAHLVNPDPPATAAAPASSAQKKSPKNKI